MLDGADLQNKLASQAGRDRLRRQLDRAQFGILGDGSADTGLMGYHRAAWQTYDAAPYIHGRHLEIISSELERVVMGETRFLMLNVAPRHSKSSMCNVSFPSWVWSLDPSRYSIAGPGVQFLNVAYAQPLATRDARKARKLMRSPWYLSRWGEDARLDGVAPKVIFESDQDQKTRYENTANGHRISVGFEGGATGEGGNIIIIDDPHKAGDLDSPTAFENAWTTYRETLANRMNDAAKDAIIIIMQRFAENDLCGRILDSEGHNWRHVCLPAEYDSEHPHPYEGDWRTEQGEPLWPEKISKPVLKAIANRLGSNAYANQYGQMGSAKKGGFFDIDEISVVEKAPRKVAARARAWDFAATDEKEKTGDPDYTAGVRLSLVHRGDDAAEEPIYDVFVEHVCRDRLRAAAVDKLVKDTASIDGPEIPIQLPQDPGAAGKNSVEILIAKLIGFDAQASPVTGSKLSRARPLSAQVEIGRVYLVRGDWNQAFLDELKSFPRGSHDDQVDAAADAFTKALQVAQEEKAGRHEAF